MYGILCKKDGNPNTTIPIVRGEDDWVMATFDTEEEAREFAEHNLMCQISAVMIVDLDNGEIVS